MKKLKLSVETGQVQLHPSQAHVGDEPALTTLIGHNNLYEAAKNPLVFGGCKML